MVDLYPRNAETLDAVFAEPGAEYRGAPFWSWNGRLDERLLRRQVDDFKTMGLGGGHIHSRVGLATAYLGEEFMACVRACVDRAREQGLLTWLYDEDRWPSGAAGGLVTCDPAYRARYLRFTPHPYGPEDDARALRSRGDVQRGEGELLARYRVELADDGALAGYARLPDGAAEAGADGAAVWYAYLETAAPSHWHNDQTYVDTLNPAAIARFIAVTHEAYRSAVGDEFGRSIFGMFTDEPNVPRTRGLADPEAETDCLLPWTGDLVASYRERWDEELLDLLPELFWEPADGRLPRVRWRFRDHVTERFATAFADQLGGWCDAHGIALTGHLLSEQTLSSQSAAVGECMRHYRSFGLPGIDMLCDAMELSTAKQAASVARQDGRPGVLSELYGVTNWDFPFAGHKRQGDWQAALGVTVRVHHLAWMTMKGNAKRDYPAAIGYQSPWYREYPVVEDHFARVNAVLTRGEPVVRIAVIHPVESFWLAMGPESRTWVEREDQERTFQGLIRDLLFAQLDFDFVAESLLPSRYAGVEDGRLHVGRMAYETVIVPALRTIRAGTLEKLAAFADAGGEVVFLGRVPDHVDAEPSTAAAALAERCARLPLLAGTLLAALEPRRDLRVERPDGRPADDVLYQLRAEGATRHLFLCCTREADLPERGVDLPALEAGGYRVRIRGRWRVTENDTATGERRPRPHRHAGGWTELRWPALRAGSLCLTLDAAGAEETAPLPAPAVWRQVGELADPGAFELHEPNVLLLDRAEMRLDDGPWRPAAEIHTAENRLRAELGWQPKGGAVVQPWCRAGREVETRRLGARLRFVGEVDLTGVELALEDADAAEIALDGEPVAAAPAGWWVDESIARVPLPDLAAGAHVLEISLPFTPDATLEWMYLLGDFGVTVGGRHARLTAPPRGLTWGDWCHQGLPFYAGNLTYRCRLDAGGGPTALRTPWFGGALVRVAVDGEDAGPVAFPPYRAVLGDLAPGTHGVAITVFGNRCNAFGALHMADPDWRWWGPDSWFRGHDRWSEEYRLRPMGLLSAPRLESLQG